MGLVHYGAPKRLIEELRAQFGIKVFVETGTFRGETTEWASGVFERVFSVEAAPEIYRKTAERLKGLQNIELRQGDTRSFLREVVASVETPALFWLDAHWCGSSETHGQSNECPILDELAIIEGSRLDHFIFIDDARLFLAPPAPPHDDRAWPTLRDLMTGPCLREARYYTQITDDVVVTVPVAARDWVVRFTRQQEHERTHRRLLEEGADQTLKGLRQVYLGIRQKMGNVIRGR